MNVDKPISAVQELDALRRFRQQVTAAIAELEAALGATASAGVPAGAVAEAVATWDTPTPHAASAAGGQVLVRRSAGPPTKVFHDAAQPCRRVVGEGRSKDNFATMSRSRAEAKGLRPCTACWSGSRWDDADES